MIVLIDLQILKQHFKVRGVHTTMLMEGFHAIQICLDPNDLMKGVFRMRERKFLRRACEFQALVWFADEHATIFDIKEEFDSTNLDTSHIIFEPFPGWQDAEDCFLDEDNITPK